MRARSRSIPVGLGIIGSLLFVLGTGCDNGGGAVQAGRGGQVGGGGTLSSGGTVATGGSAATGGATSTGGNPGAGGSTGSSAATGTGGAASVGGAVGTGGRATGGALGVGGAASTGGTSTGGTSTGGSPGGGGRSGTGGTGSGGASSTGGAVGTGGRSGTGGSATGGAGGVTSTGGTTATGGTVGTGGVVSTGGSTGPSCTADYTWPAYSPTIAYDYVDEYGTLSPPTKESKDCNNIAGSYHKDWWAFYYGANKNSLVTAAAWVPMVDRFNTDFGYISDTMRWPRDSRARAGYYSAIYLYGSGLCTDTAANTDTGGWQSSVGGYPMVLASYYPVYSFDPACTYSDRTTQMGAMIHEGIHCILASMPGCKNACWFQEGGNTWLQATMEAKRSGGKPTSMGFLSAGAAVAPFMPVESYSGWLQDDSFGGPCAERVNMYSGSQQVCTWRNLLGGNQYGETFPHALEVILGEESVAWIWRYASKSGRVLQDLAEVTNGIGATQTRRLIQEYRARQVFGDFGMWQTAYKKLLNDNWKASIKAEWQPSWMNPPAWSATCYASTTQSGSDLTPETRTLPGWSGANQIPLTLAAGASCATVTFTPTGKNMTCQLVYQDTSGGIHYGNPVASGQCSIPTSNVKNNVVIAVLANTDYIYDGGTTKYGYTITLGDGISGKADIYTQWYK